MSVCEREKRDRLEEREGTRVKDNAKKVKRDTRTKTRKRHERTNNEIERPAAKK